MTTQKTIEEVPMAENGPKKPNAEALATMQAGIDKLIEARVMVSKDFAGTGGADANLLNACAQLTNAVTNAQQAVQLAQAAGMR